MLGVRVLYFGECIVAGHSSGMYYWHMQLTQDEIARLSPNERLALIAQLWDSLDDHEVPLPRSQRDELDRRLARLDEDRSLSVTWDELKADLARRRP